MSKDKNIFHAGRFPTASSGDGSTPLTALLVHKNPALAGELKRTIAQLGEYKISLTEASSPDEALKLVYGHSFDVIFFDLESVVGQNISQFVDFVLQVPIAPVITLTSIEWAGLGRESVLSGAQDWLPIEGMNPELLGRSIGYAQERHQLKEALRSMALIDSTTGLYNKTGFTAVALPQLQIAARARRPYLIFNIDVLDLEEILAKHGQKERSNAMVLVAHALWHCFRKTDVIGRTGTEEFAVYANDATTKFADMMIERIKDYLIERKKSEGWPFTLRVKMGYLGPEPDFKVDNSMDELIRRARVLAS